MISKHVGLKLPEYLDSGKFDFALDDVRRRIGFNAGAVRLFNMAWHGVASRALAADLYLARAVELPAYGYQSTHANNLDHDMVLVAYLQSICSSVDCLAFAAFALAANVLPNEFSIANAEQLRSVTPVSVAKRLMNSWPGEPLTALLKGLAYDPHLRFIFDVRDVVTHRGTLPRMLYVGGDRAGKVTIPTQPKLLPDAWTSDLDLSVATLEDWRTTMAGHLGPAPDAVLNFMQKYCREEGPARSA